MTNGETVSVLRKLALTPVQFKDAISGAFFMKKPIDVFMAAVEINKKLTAEGDVSVEDWYDFLDIPYPIRDRFEVWCIECLLDRGETWVNFIYDYEEDKEHGLYFTVMPEQWPCDAYWECKGGCD